MHKYYTQSTYDHNYNGELSFSLEDYLEMIYRLSLTHPIIKTTQIARQLNVNVASASKMINKLKEKEYLEYPPYGSIKLTLKGKTMGSFLLDRHNTIHKFLTLLNESDEELELTEKIEHYIDLKTLLNLKKYMEKKQ